MQLLDRAITPPLLPHDLDDSACTMMLRDQARIAALIERYRNGPRDQGRGRLRDQIQSRLVLHMAIGHQLLCPLLQRLKPMGPPLDEISIGHYVIEQLLRRMRDPKTSARQRDALMNALDDYLEQFFIEEQHTMLSPLHASPVDLDALGERVRAEKRRIAPWLGLDEDEV